MSDDDEKTTELIRRAKLQQARREAGLGESTLDSSDAEYDAPPPEWWDGRGGPDGR